MNRSQLIFALLLAAAIDSPATAASPTSLGVIPLRLTDAEPSYLGVALPLCAFPGPGRGSQDARLPVTNDGGNHAEWGASIPLLVVDSRQLGDLTEARVVPLGFDLMGTQIWSDSCGSVTYTVRLNENAIQPQSLIYFSTDDNGSPTAFAGILYVAGILNKTDVNNGVLSTQTVPLALNLSGKWTSPPPEALVDPELSTLLPYTELDPRGLPTDRYSCATETHPYGRYCLQISPSLLASFDGR